MVLNSLVRLIENNNCSLYSGVNEYRFWFEVLNKNMIKSRCPLPKWSNIENNSELHPKSVQIGYKCHQLKCRRVFNWPENHFLYSFHNHESESLIEHETAVISSFINNSLINF